MDKVRVRVRVRARVRICLEGKKITQNHPPCLSERIPQSALHTRPVNPNYSANRVVEEGRRRLSVQQDAASKGEKGYPLSSNAAFLQDLDTFFAPQDTDEVSTSSRDREQTQHQQRNKHQKLLVRDSVRFDPKVALSFFFILLLILFLSVLSFFGMVCFV